MSESAQTTAVTVDAEEREEVVDDFLYEIGQVERRAQVARVLQAFRLNGLEILGLRSDATSKEIKRAYKKLSMSVHPDKCGEDIRQDAEKAFTLVNEAKKDLLDEDKRRALQAVINQARARVKSAKDEEMRKQIKANLKRERARQLAREEKKRAFDAKVDDNDDEEEAKRVTTGTGVQPDGSVDPTLVWEERDTSEDKDFETLVMAQTKEILIENEWKKRELEKEAARIDAQAAKERQESLEKMKAKQEKDKEWEDGRDSRISAWRRFQKGAVGGSKKKKKGTKRKLGMLHPPKLTEEDPNATYIKRVVKRG